MSRYLSLILVSLLGINSRTLLDGVTRPVKADAGDPEHQGPGLSEQLQLPSQGAWWTPSPSPALTPASVLKGAEINQRCQGMRQ